jgi:hypothetical protein
MRLVRLGAMRCSDAMGAVGELAASQHGAFSRRQAAAIGLTRRQIQILIRDRFLDEPVRGVLRVRGAPSTWKQQMMIATLVGPGFYAAFRAAAYLHGIDGFQKQPTVEVAGGPSCRSIKGLDVVQHWVEPLDVDDLVVIDGIPCLGLARTVVDVCGLGDRDLALRSVDDFERRGFSLNWLRLTAERLHRPGQSGTRVVRDLLDRRQTGGRVPDTWFERLVEHCLAMAGLPPWVRQHEVFDDTGARLGRLDLACPDLLLGVEAHSKRFHFGQRAESMDQRRENRFGTVGWHVTYVGWYDTEAPATVAATIEAIARRRIEMFGLGEKSRRAAPM